jgi:TonB family protein
MGTNKEQTSESDDQANYEAAVLDFLDREMAAVQPNKHREESGEEVDALVTDLLKQVITESDQPSGGPTGISEDLEDILSEFPPAEANEVPAGSENLESSGQTAIPPIETRQEAPVNPKQEMPVGELFNPRLPNFALGMGPRRKIPIIIAASIGLLVVIGTAVYYLWGSSKGSADPQEYQAAASAPAAHENTYMVVPATLNRQNMDELAPPSPIPEPVAPQLSTPKPAKKSSAVSISSSASAYPGQNAASLEFEPDAYAAGDQPTDPALERDSALVVVKPLTTQTSTSSPLTVVPNLAIDKSILPPMPDGISITSSALERNPAQSVPALLTDIKNSSLVSQTQTPAPAGSRDLAPSVLISQVTPAYPELAIRSRISGSVVLELQIDSEGKVIEVTPVSGPSVFYSEAVKAAMQYRYRPARLDGRNVSSESRVTMVFNLNR